MGALVENCRKPPVLLYNTSHILYPSSFQFAGRTLCVYWRLIFGIDLEEMVDDNQNHGCRAKEDGKAVKLAVGNHDRGGVDVGGRRPVV